MIRILILPLVVLIVVLSLSNSNAQWQFCFGVSPGIGKMFPTHPVEELTLPPKMSITLQSGINYSFSSKVSTMLLLSYANYNVTTWESELEGSYHYPLSKKLRIKSSAGIALSILNLPSGNSGVHMNYLPSAYLYHQDNLFIVMKSGLQWKAPGIYHSVYFGVNFLLAIIGVSK